jgi:hypothetical protein
MVNWYRRKRVTPPVHTVWGHEPLSSVITDAACSCKPCASLHAVL